MAAVLRCALEVAAGVTTEATLEAALRTALSPQAAFLPCAFISVRSDAAASLITFRRRSLPMF